MIFGKSQTYFFILAITVLFSLSAPAQNYQIKGKVIDKTTLKPLAFVNILYGNKKGVTSSIDGIFFIESSQPITQLRCSFIGYRDTTIAIPSNKKNYSLRIEMQATTLNLASIKILPSENPANKIVQKAIAFKSVNNPRTHLKTFSFSSYNKLYMTVKSDVVKELKQDTIKKPKITEYKKDTSQKTENTSPIINDSAKQFLEHHHLFLIETVKESFFEQPGKRYERVIASKVSGFTIPTLFGLATELQSFSFYPDKVSLLGQNYLSPLSKNSDKKYLFIIEDSLFVGNDTVYVISFQPHKNKQFNALKGLMYLRTPTYAVTNVIAEPFKKSDLFNIRIQQKYQFFNQQQWVPKELYATFSYVVDTSENGQIIGVNKTYINDIHLNPNLDSIHFGSMSFELKKNAFKLSSSQWKTLRPIPLTPKEQATYQSIDSLGKKNHFNRLYKIYNVLLDGNIPLGNFVWELNRILDFNFVEGFRVQGGLSTANRFSKTIKLGGYLAYGFKDKLTKYNGYLAFNINRFYNLKWKLSYTYDALEFGGFDKFYDNQNKLLSANNEGLYSQFTSGLYYFQQWQSAFSFRLLRYLKGEWTTNILQPSFYQVIDMVSQHQLFLPQAPLPAKLYETGINLKYAYGDKIIRALDHIYYEGTHYPVIWFSYKRGFIYDNAGQNFEKLQLRIQKAFYWNNTWQTNVEILAGKLTGNYPVFYTFNGKGIKTFAVDFQINNSFQTIHQYEFFADQIASFHFSQTFAKWQLSKQCTPRLRLDYNFEIGSLSNPALQTQYNLQSLNHGYHEAGVLVENLWNGKWSSSGFGVYYRMGNYAYPTPIQNFAFTFVSTFNF